MKIEPGTMCLNCGENPAVSADKTVPLCGACAALAKGRGRGINRPSKPKDKASSLV